MMTDDKQAQNRDAGFPVAVIGLHGRFPGASDAQTFWENLRDGRDAITTIPPERWDYAALLGEPEGTEERTYATTGGFTPNVGCFDCEFFNILPREAESMDPQQRLFLQTAWQACEDAGLAPRDLAGTRVGVFVGVGHADYPVLMRRDGAPFDVFRATGIVPTAIANRVSFSLDLRGPSESIDTACSGSLVAIHRAVRALEMGECDLAIAGGVNLLLGPELFIAFAKAGMLSRFGRCRVLDAESDGYVRGEGVAALILRPLVQAEAGNDFIYGVIRGSAENHNGKTHSFTAPGVSGQADVITRAWARAGLSVRDASLMEMHGTGTPLGDPIEIRGLKKAFDEAPRGAKAVGASDAKVALGALKSQVGHLEAAAGIGGVIKTLLSLHNGLVPPNLHYRRLNPQINLEGTPFFVPVAPVPLRSEPDRPPLAGVSSFGFGGVNAHVVIEGYKRPDAAREHSEPRGDTAAPYLIVMSARNERALSRRAEQLLTFLEAADSFQPRSNLENIQRVGEALGLGSLTEDSDSLRLDSLDLSEGQLLVALKRLSATAAAPIGIRDIRDCVTMGELARRLDQKLSRPLDTPADSRGGDTGLPRVALAAETLRGVDLATISYSLMQGRDTMHERLAIVTKSRAELAVRLRTFLKGSNAPHPELIRGSILSQQNVPSPEPVAREDAATPESLEEWARYWVSNRGAKLRWSDLHRARAPSKIPLPAYPFELRKIWYAARGRLDSARSMTTGALTRNMPTELGASEDADGGVPTPRPPSPEIPATISGLALLLEHLAAKRGNAAVHLSHIEFSQPLVLDIEMLTCRDGRRGETEIAQCLHQGKSGSRVVVQACVGSAIELVLPSARGSSQEMRILPVLDVYRGAERMGVKVAAVDRRIEVAREAPNALSLKLLSPPSTNNRRAGWSALLLSVLAGGAYLHGGASQSRPGATALCFFRARGIAFDSPAAEEATEIEIERDQTDGSLHVVAYGGGGRRIFEIRGLQLREAPAPRRSIAASASPAAPTALAS